MPARHHHRAPLTEAAIGRFAREHHVSFRPKSASQTLRLIGVLLRALGNERFPYRWTTIGRTIYYPKDVRHPPAHPRAVEHEFVHVRQWERWGPLLWVSYLLLPLPIGLAWCRWRWEREAYLVELAAHDNKSAALDRIVQALWSGYAWPWPRSWMRRWFRRQLARQRPSGIDHEIRSIDA